VNGERRHALRLRAVSSGAALLRAGDELRVTAQLADAASGTLVWSQVEQAPVGDLFRLQDSLVERITASLSRPLSERDARQIRRDVPATPKAYEYYLRANEASRPSTHDANVWAVARDLYLQSIEEDPRYAPAWARLARVYRLLGKYRAEESDANMARAEDALKRAVALNPDLSMAQNLYAHIEIDRGRAADAMVRLLEHARDRGGDAEIFAGLVQACRFCGLLDASIAANAQAQKLDPTLGTSVMHTYFVMRRYEDVVRTSTTLKGYVYALALAGLGRNADALDLLAQLDRQGTPAGRDDRHP
jgi:tetratricopeptide (TPR) repeat protein